MKLQNTPPRIYSYDQALYGGSKWATHPHLQSMGYGEKGPILLGYGLPFKKRRPLITSATKMHRMTVAPTRGGKGSAATIPACTEHKGPLVAVCPKSGEEAIITAQFRRDVLGRNVIIIDPWECATKFLDIEPSCFNPVDFLDAKRDDFVEKAMLLAESIVVAAFSKEPFWVEEAIALVAGLIMWVAATPKILFPTKKKSKDLTQVRRLLCLPAKKFKEMVGGVYKKKVTQDDEGNKTENWELVRPGMLQSPHEAISEAAGRILNKAERELSGVMSTAQQNTHFLSIPAIQRSLSKTDFDMAELEGGEMDLFIVVPGSRIKLGRRFLRLHLNTVVTTVTQFEHKPDPSVLILIEEFSALGKMDVVEDAYSLLAGFGAQFHIVLQNLSQLVSLSPENWHSYVANSGIIQVFGNNDIFTMEYISKLCGTTTIETLSESTAQLRAGLTADPHYLSKEDALTTRALITPDAIRTLSPAFQILILAHADPVIAYKPVYYLDRRYRNRRDVPLYNTHPHYADRPVPASLNFHHLGCDIEAALLDTFIGG